MKGAADALAGKDDGPSLAMRARLETAIAQSMNDRAGLVDKAEGDKLRKDAKQVVIDAAPLAQKAVKAAADDASANLAMADVLRLQGKPAKDVARYLEKAKAAAKDDKELVRSIGLCLALVNVRDGKLDDAVKNLGATDAADDTRVKFATALVAYQQNRVADAKPLVEPILAAQADHDGARALGKKLATAVAKTDPMPSEDGRTKTPQRRRSIRSTTVAVAVATTTRCSRGRTSSPSRTAARRWSCSARRSSRSRPASRR